MNLVKHPKYEHIEVSECGTVVFSRLSNRPLTQTKTTNGYLVVRIQEVGKSKRVHRLVCETFQTDSPFYGLDVNHKDGNKENNHNSNLEWCTRSHNILHALDTGLNPSRGETNSQAVYTEALIREACELLQDGWRNVDVTVKLGIDKSYLSEIRSGRKWAHISKEYNLKVRRNNRYSERTVRRVCQLLQEGKTPAQVSKEVRSEITYRDISRIRNKETWRSISEEYTFPESRKLKESDVRLICEKLSTGCSVRSIVGCTEYSFDQIYKIYKRKTWVEVSCEYKF